MAVSTCLLIMLVHTKSFFIALTSMLNICISIVFTIWVYHYILGITYFSSMNMIVLIIIVGIGADDIFVFHDTWKSTFNNDSKFEDDPLNRVIHTFKTAGNAMFVTTLTSAVSFFGCTLSHIKTIKAFGWFAFLIIIVVYLVTILVQPVNYYFYEVYIMRNKKKSNGLDNESDHIPSSPSSVPTADSLSLLDNVRIEFP